MNVFSSSKNTKKSPELNFIWLEITGKCNLECTHCYADSTPLHSLEGKMLFSDWIRVIDEAVELGCKGVQFIGGEPTLHPKFRELVSYCNEKRFENIEVFTNATRLGAEIVKCFSENNVHVATSFYSREPSVHERITRRDKSWERTVSGIKSILDADIPLRVGVIQTNGNEQNISSTVSFLEELGVRQIGIDRQRKIGRGQIGSDLEASGEERYSELCGQCWKQRLCITASGDVYPCVFSRATLLGSAKDSLKSLCESTKLEVFKQRLRLAERQKNLSSQCYPDAPCSPQVCSPQLDCQPNRFCTPDAQCQPHYNSPSLT
jgi:MoaA/NifB/PqqE/SkfB family radical SAM enzyme